MNKGKLTIVGTPIGNIFDISLRQIRLILLSQLVLAEDTRVFMNVKRKLIEHISRDEYQFIDKQELMSLVEKSKNQSILSYRDQNHEKMFPKITKLLDSGEKIILVSDSGMPTISDPGYKLVHDIYENDYTVDVVPGPTAVSSALVLSGLPTDRFVFLGFLPRRKSRITKLIEQFIESEVTIIFYESPFRLLKTLELLSEKFSDIEVAAISEITKKFQKVIRGDVENVINQLKNLEQIKGEWVVCLRKNKID